MHGVVEGELRLGRDEWHQGKRSGFTRLRLELQVPLSNCHGHRLGESSKRHSCLSPLLRVVPVFTQAVKRPVSSRDHTGTSRESFFMRNCSADNSEPPTDSAIPDTDPFILISRHEYVGAHSKKTFS
jgi:hypothetical protein